MNILLVDIFMREEIIKTQTFKTQKLVKLILYLLCIIQHWLCACVFSLSDTIMRKKSLDRDIGSIAENTSIANMFSGTRLHILLCCCT